MGVGPSNLAIVQADDDLRRLEWGDIEEKLAFFRNWDMQDVSSAITRFKGMRRALDKNRPPRRGSDAVEFLARRTSWSALYQIT